MKRLAAVALVGCFALLATQSALRESATYDESFNIVSGCSLWRAGRLPPAQDNPPLLLRWLSAPLTAVRGLAPFDAAACLAGPRACGFSFLYLNAVPPDVLLNLCRGANILLGVLLALLTGLWAFQLGGGAAGLFALAVFAFMPPLLAHAHLATADIGNALLCSSAAYLLWRGSLSPGKWSAAAAGLVCGLALAGKYTAGVMVPFGLLCLWFWGGDRVKMVAAWCAALAAGLFIGCFPVSPGEWLLTGLRVARAVGAGHVTYLLGEVSGAGKFYYFPLALALKTPLPALFLASAGLYGFHPRLPADRARLLYLAAPAALWLGLGIFSNTQVGIRHILPVYPLLCVWAGLAASSLWKSGKPVLRGAVCVLFGWLAVGTLKAFPWYISYFNEAAGGARGGHRFLLDSNLDWGQGLKELGKYAQEQGARHIYLSYFGCADPHAYGIKYAPVLSVACSGLPGDGPPPAGRNKVLLAVSATNRFGVYYTPRGAFSWLDGRRPARIIADSIWVYDLTGDREAQRLLNQPQNPG